MSAPEAVVLSFAPPTVLYSMWNTLTVHGGVPLRARTWARTWVPELCVLASVASCASRSAAEVDDTSSGGFCSSVPRAVLELAPELEPPPSPPSPLPSLFPPQPMSSQATSAASGTCRGDGPTRMRIIARR